MILETDGAPGYGRAAALQPATFASLSGTVRTIGGLRQALQPGGDASSSPRSARRSTPAACATAARLSFHHHLRNGDGVLNSVMDGGRAARPARHPHRRQLDFAVHAPLVEHIRSGVVTPHHDRLRVGPGRRCGVARGCCRRRSCMRRTAGGRGRWRPATFPIDVAFVAARQRTPTATSAVGGARSLRRARLSHGRRRVADMWWPITDRLLPIRVPAIDIPQDHVDFVVEVPSRSAIRGHPLGHHAADDRGRDRACSIAETAARSSRHAGCWPRASRSRPAPAASRSPRRLQ